MKKIINKARTKLQIAQIIYSVERKFNKPKRQALREAMTVFWGR